MAMRMLKAFRRLGRLGIGGKPYTMLVSPDFRLQFLRRRARRPPRRVHGVMKCDDIVWLHSGLEGLVRDVNDYPIHAVMWLWRWFLLPWFSFPLPFPFSLVLVFSSPSISSLFLSLSFIHCFLFFLNFRITMTLKIQDTVGEGDWWSETYVIVLFIYSFQLVFIPGIT